MRVQMNELIDCIRCHTRMEIGFSADATYGGYLQQNWYPGTPQKSFWTGLKLKRRQKVPMTALRCPKCGYLEFYATPQRSTQQD